MCSYSLRMTPSIAPLKKPNSPRGEYRKELWIPKMLFPIVVDNGSKLSEGFWFFWPQKNVKKIFSSYFCFGKSTKTTAKFDLSALLLHQWHPQTREFRYSSSDELGLKQSKIKQLNVISAV